MAVDQGGTEPVSLERSSEDKGIPRADIKRGYRFWFIIIATILIVEVLGAVRGWDWWQDNIGINIPWTTISGMVGHLEDLWPTTAVIVVAVLAPAAFYALAPVDPPAVLGPVRRSSSGRWYLKPDKGEPDERAKRYTPELVFVLCVIAAALAIFFLEDDFQRAYVIYGALFFFGIAVPSILVLARRNVGFPSLFVTISHLRERHDVKAVLATIALSAGLAILVIHLAFYPWPDITKPPVKYAGLTAKEARTKASKGVDPQLEYSTQARGVVAGKEAWLVYFSEPDGSDSGCVVIVKDEGPSDPTPECSD